MSPRRNWDSPNPSPVSEWAPPPPNQRVWGGTLACGWGVGESQFRRLEKKLSTLPTPWLSSKPRGKRRWRHLIREAFWKFKNHYRFLFWPTCSYFCPNLWILSWDPVPFSFFSFLQVFRDLSDFEVLCWHPAVLYAKLQHWILVKSHVLYCSSI